MFEVVNIHFGLLCLSLWRTNKFSVLHLVFPLPPLNWPILLARKSFWSHQSFPCCQFFLDLLLQTGRYLSRWMHFWWNIFLQLDVMLRFHLSQTFEEIWVHFQDSLLQLFSWSLFMFFFFVIFWCYFVEYLYYP